LTSHSYYSLIYGNHIKCYMYFVKVQSLGRGVTRILRPKSQVRNEYNTYIADS